MSQRKGYRHEWPKNDVEMGRRSRWHNPSRVSTHERATGLASKGAAARPSRQPVRWSPGRKIPPCWKIPEVSAPASRSSACWGWRLKALSAPGTQSSMKAWIGISQVVVGGIHGVSGVLRGARPERTLPGKTGSVAVEGRFGIDSFPRRRGAKSAAHKDRAKAICVVPVAGKVGFGTGRTGEHGNDRKRLCRLKHWHRIRRSRQADRCAVASDPREKSQNQRLSLIPRDTAATGAWRALLTNHGRCAERQSLLTSPSVFALARWRLISP